MPRESSNRKLLETLQANWIAEMSGFYTYSHLAEKESDPSRRRVLRELASAEKHHADLWADRLHALGGEVPSVERAMVLRNDLNEPSGEEAMPLRMLEVEESRDIARYGEQLHNLGDEPSVAILTEVLKDEQGHYRALQKLSRSEASDVPNISQAQVELDRLLAARESSKTLAGTWIGDAVYGVNDGLGSIFGIVSGVSGATLGNSHFVLIAGIAGMIASALSMGSGAYLARKSEREIYEAQFAAEEQKVRLNPVEARELLSLSYQVRGVPARDADHIAEHFAVDERRLAEALAREHLKISEESLANPWTAAISGALSTAVGAFIPIVPFFFMSGIRAVVVAAIVSLVAHFAVGSAKALITIRVWWKSGLEMTWIGALEGAVTYVIGIGLGHAA